MRLFQLCSPPKRRDKLLRNPRLCLEKPDGTEEPATEEDMYTYRRHRWLFNEERELKCRHLRFDLQNLVKIAIDVAGDGAQSCTKVLKCVEGLHNKALLLTMDNGKEVFVKLPNPNAGPARYITASEVATREFFQLSEIANVPIPRVLAWSSDSANPVEAEYIMEEKAPGTRLGSLWHLWPRESKLRVIEQIVDLEHLLTTIKFSKHGCLYFKEDLQQSFHELNDNLLVDPPMDSTKLGRYAIGPLASAELWSNGRESMDLDRGPWRRPEEYAKALGKNEIAWIETHASPRTNAYVSLKAPELPYHALSLLSKYLDATPYLVPDNPIASANVLWHPDLHLDNVFVDPMTCKITGIVDWQGTSVAPLFYQSCVPRMFRHAGPVREGWVVPTRPANFDTLKEHEQRRVDQDLENETIHKYYEAKVYKRAPHHWEVLKDQRGVELRRDPTCLVTGVWENRQLFFLRQSLIAIAAFWDKLRPDETVESPLSFTKEELDLHAKEDENMTGVGNMLKLFRDEGVLPVDGMVDPDNYQTAMINCRKFRDVFIGSAKDEGEKELFSKLWPYQNQEP
ncbi:hypothetical protein AJ78_00677 [Emergomyces pasteurianus Ep9510]|uniref:Aminoglycoside phosphotransferase domain-containing protein n=1 Tax=Emergomyces pasteurianus Ep9510 TaxID=1447872 RepID=A0A1J9PSS8_9EURO|nr:hypothetical protein AJ78_00677 [Emergomyces pasteurianus Ep9510]